MEYFYEGRYESNTSCVVYQIAVIMNLRISLVHPLQIREERCHSQFRAICANINPLTLEMDI